MLQRTFFIIILSIAFYTIVIHNETDDLPNSSSIIVEELVCEAQFYTLIGNEGGEITGNYGTHLTFPPYAFIDNNDEVITDSIDIQLIEFHIEGDNGTSYHPEATDNNSILTNGTFELKAFYNNKPLQFHPHVDLESILLK